MDEIPTPRTDEHSGASWQFTDCTEVIEADKCRQLERELTIAKQDLEKAEAEIDILKYNLIKLQCSQHLNAKTIALLLP